jgi:hypothetical protein
VRAGSWAGSSATRSISGGCATGTGRGSGHGGLGPVRSGGGQRSPALDRGRHRFTAPQPLAHPGQTLLQVRLRMAQSVQDLCGAGEQLVDI